jgi:hypothetical protein
MWQFWLLVQAAPFTFNPPVEARSRLNSPLNKGRPANIIWFAPFQWKTRRGEGKRYVRGRKGKRYIRRGEGRRYVRYIH